MMPSANSWNANAPAIGRSACAACSAVAMSVMPLACRVTAVVSMMQRAIAFE
jgi:hypothetical protein